MTTDNVDSQFASILESIFNYLLINERKYIGLAFVVFANHE